METDKQCITLAVLKAKKGKRAALLSELLKLIDPTRRESGCLDYVLFEDENLADTFYMREAFKDQDAFNFHLRTPHFKAFAEQIDTLMAEPIQLIKLNQISK